MDSKIPIVNYQRTNAALLLHYADKLFQNEVFHRYLTPPQLIVLNKVLSIENIETKEKIWEELISGNVFLDVNKKADDVNVNPIGEEVEEEMQVDVSPIDAINVGADPITTEKKEFTTINSEKQEESSTESDRNNKAAEKPENILANQEIATLRIENKKEEELPEEPDFSEFDLQDLQQQMSGTEFVGNLSLKIRYVLWENAIDPLCDPTHEDDSEYVFFDESPEYHIEASGNGNSNKLSQDNISDRPVSQDDIHEEDDNYDYDEEEESVPNRNVEFNETSNIELVYQESGRLVLKLEISKATLAGLGVTNTQSIIENFNKIYHNFENDRETLLKRLKLEESDKLLEPSKKRKRNELSDASSDEEESYESDDDKKKSESHGTVVSNLPVTLGSANLSLKHLLASIQENKSKLNISDYELRHLIMDVRKNRSKWASDDKIGQEELYDACEKVVLELRNYTEHSTAFLNKVSKREAPNYYQIIKKPMDLNTVLKKLKTYQYNSKQQFVDDLMLIWKNCLSYNSDPKHFLRAHAIAMQKKALSLIPLIPDIVVRDRMEVEKEIEEIDKENGKDVEAEEVSGTGRKGGNVRGIKHISDDDCTDDKENDLQDEMDNETRNEDQASNNDEASDSQQFEDHETNGGKNPIKVAIDASTDHKVKGSKSSKKVNHGQKVPREEDVKEQNVQERNENGKKEEDDDDEEEDEEEEGIDSEMYLVERDDDRDDLELSTWKSLTATARAEICVKRADLFKAGKLNNESTAILRNPGKMKEFDQFLKEYKEEQEGELQRRKLDQESTMKNGFGTVIKQEESELPHIQLQEAQNIVNEGGIGKDSNEIEVDDGMFLMEYNVANSVPEIGYRGIDNEMLEKEEAAMVQRILSDEHPQPSIFVANKDKGLSPKVNSNIHLIQEIRHICHKISLIRMLQNPQNPSQQSKSNMMNANNQIWNTHRYKYTNIDEDLDIDPVSQLPTHDYKNDKHLIWRVMHKNVSKIAMSNGFESTQPTAINMLTEIAGNYLSNLMKTIKVHQESSSLNLQKPSDILCMSLQENGINKPDDLYTYMETEFIKKTNKLKDVKLKLNAFLKDLLRPTLQELSERNFEDESQSFVTGDFSSELTGEDFFGFKDLGLDKEFGVLSNSVPLQLLTFQFRGKGAETKIKDKKIQPEEFDNVTYSRVTKDCIEQGKYWNTLRPLLEKACNRTKTYYSKNGKNKTFESNSSEETAEDASQTLLEDEDIPSKSKSSGKPRLPPTGKINTNYKKKSLADAFFLPEAPSEDTRDEKRPALDASNTITENPVSEASSFENLFGIESTPPETSFSLSLPRVDE